MKISAVALTVAALLAFGSPLAVLASSHKDASTATGDAPMPACSKSDPIVWINTKTHVYHPQGDAYFGKTKAGKYACTSKAVALGAHAPGGKSGKAAPAVDAPDDDDATPAATTSKHKKKHGSSASSMSGGDSSGG